MLNSRIWILVALVIVIGVPVALRKDDAPEVRRDGQTVVVITPHPESIRQEFGRAFAEWYLDRTGQHVYVDWRVIGGTSEIARFLRSEYTNAFRNHWVQELGREWSGIIQEAFNNPELVPGDDPARDTHAMAARRAFLESSVSSGIDIMFGGGSYDFSLQAGHGHLVDSGIRERFPEWFAGEGQPGTMPSGIPERFAGERFYDEHGRWIGAVLSGYGIIYNRDSIRRLGIERNPANWEDLTDPRFFRQIAVCDPTKSGAMTQAFEMILQQQMRMRLDALDVSNPELGPQERRRKAVEEGWMAGMRIIQKISANARYFTDSSQKPNIDVAMGDCAAGLSIDFYGRFQQENILMRSSDPRFGFISPVGGTTISADPIGMLRGARNPDVGRAFLEFVLSHEGQKLWNWKPGTEGGPAHYALRRLPIRPDMYAPEYEEFRSDPEFNPFIDARDFYYERDWTGRLFTELRNVIRIAFVDLHHELAAAWGAIIEAREQGRWDDADRAEAVLIDLEAIRYEQVETEIRRRLRSAAIEEVRLGRELGDHFRRQYRKAAEIARGG